MKKFLRCSSLVAMALALASCGGGGNQESDTEFNATIWVSESKNTDTGVSVVDLTKQQIDAWNKSNGKYKINATVEGISEADAATQMLTDVESGADLFCFAQDQMNRLINAGALNKLGSAASAKVTEENDAGSVNATKVNGEIYAYPFSADNGYFMYYDKSVVKVEHLNSLEDIVADCVAAGRNFSMENETSAWYLASWFFGAGCVSEWTADTSGKFTSVTDTFDSDAGVIAMRGMQHLVKSSCYVSSSKAADFSAATPSAVVITGTWDSTTAKAALGDNYACAKLPSYHVDGKEYQMGSYSGYKFMGVKPQANANKTAALNQLAQYLSSEEAQLERFNNFGWGPSNLVAAKNDAVLADPALSALLAQAPYSIAQGQIHGSWWDVAKVLGDSAKAAEQDDTAALKSALDNYKNELGRLLSMTDEERRAFSVIGSLNGSDWKTDYKMTETEKNSNIWISDDVFVITEESITKGYNEFQCRQGLAWNVQFGKDGTKENFIITEPGSYKIKLTYNATDKTGVVELLDQAA